MAKSAGNIPSITERFSLTNQDVTEGRPNLSAFVIRLTDASMKSLNEAVSEAKRAQSNWRDGCIDIRANEITGKLSFGGSSHTGHQFSIVDAQRDLGPTGQLQAIAQLTPSSPNMESGGRMQAVVVITKRMHISATTKDTFESTNQKAKQATQEMRKNVAKVLKEPASGTGLSGKKKVLQKIFKAKDLMHPQRPITPLSRVRSSSPAVTIPVGKTNSKLTISTNTNKSRNVNESLDDTDDSTQRVKTRAAYKPPPKRPADNSSVDTHTLSTASGNPRTAATINGVRYITIGGPPPLKRTATPTVSSESIPVKDYEAEYPPIESLENRLRYKQMFDEDYTKYLKIYDHLKSVSMEWQTFGDKLKSIPNTDPARRQLERDILCRYEKFENDAEIKSMKKQYEELKVKLNVLKTRVKDYDDILAKAI